MRRRSAPGCHQQGGERRHDAVGLQVQQGRRCRDRHEGSGAQQRAQGGDAQRQQVGQRDPAQCQVHRRQQCQRQAHIGAGAGLDQEHVDDDQHLQQREADALDGAHAARFGAAARPPTPAPAA